MINVIQDTPYAVTQQSPRILGDGSRNSLPIVHRLEIEMKLEAKERLQSKIGPIEHGSFHKWLGKSEDEPITEADIQKGLKAGGHAAKMANFARNAKKWKHK